MLYRSPGVWEHLKIIPGMKEQVDIETGEKSIFAYLLRPISRVFYSAFTERSNGEQTMLLADIKV